MNRLSSCQPGVGLRRLGDPLVLPDDTGRSAPLHWNNIYHRDFLPLLKRLRLPRIRPYDLRHFNIPLLARERVSPKVIAVRAGHHSEAFTLGRYTHADAEMQQEAARAISRRLASNEFLTKSGPVGGIPTAGVMRKPLSYPGFLARPEGLEPPTYGSGGRRSIH